MADVFEVLGIDHLQVRQMHPHTPANPAVLKTAGPAVAAADKLRDAVTGRGEEQQRPGHGQPA